MAFAFLVLFQQTKPYQSESTGKLAVNCSYAIVLTYFMGILIQAGYFDDEDPVVGSFILSFALALIITALVLSWWDIDDLVAKTRKIDLLHVEMQKKQQKHKKVGGG